MKFPKPDQPRNVDEHWAAFVDFVGREVASGGPDPQIDTVGYLCKGRSLAERVWLIGCYGASHCVPTAAFTWAKSAPFPPDDSFYEWVLENSKKLPMRPEMRNHNMPAKRVECLRTFTKLASEYDPSAYTSYQDVWDDTINRVKYYGRYMAIKVLEMLYRFGDTPCAESIDMRVKGGWYPRKTIALLYPEYPQVGDKKDESPATVDLVNRLGAEVIDVVADCGTTISFFQLQVLCCEYREYLNGSYAPGGSHAEEDEYVEKVRSHFGPEAVAPVVTARRKLFGGSRAKA